MRPLRVPVVIGVLFAVLWIFGGSSINAQPYPPPTMTIIPSQSPTPSAPPTDPPPSVSPSGFESATPTPPSNVPVTGADLARFVLIGAGLTFAGTGLVRLARRARQP